MVFPGPDCWVEHAHPDGNNDNGRPGDIAPSLALGAPEQLAGSATQLGVDLVGMTVAGVSTLLTHARSGEQSAPDGPTPAHNVGVPDGLGYRRPWHRRNNTRPGHELRRRRPHPSWNGLAIPPAASPARDIAERRQGGGTDV